MTALAAATVLSRIREVIVDATGVDRVYCQSETDENRLPAGDIEGLAVLVMTGPTLEYILINGMHRRTYHVRVLIVVGGADFGERTAEILPIVDAICEVFAVNVTLGGRATYGVFDSSSGLVSLEWSGVEYTGEVVTLRVSEAESIATGPGE